MRDFAKQGIVIALGFSLGLTIAPRTAVAKLLPDTAVWTTQDQNQDLDGMLYKTGIRAGASNIPLDYFVDPTVKEVFVRNQDLRENMPAELPNDFQQVVTEIEEYIAEEASSSTEEKNGFTHHQLAEKIVRASFCFGTDAKMVAAKIRMESVFAKKAVSPTGAVGLSQLTGIALQEVNDQLGNRGNDHAPADNAVFFKKSIKCFLGQELKYPWTIGLARPNKAMSKDEIKDVKKWIQQDIDRDLIYGQTLLKLYLAVTKDDSTSKSDNYADAFVRYNGDNAKVGKTKRKFVYSKAVMGYFQNIDYDPTQDSQLWVPSTPAEKREIKTWNDVYSI